MTPKRAGTVKVSGGYPWAMIFFILFLALKLSGHIDWSWWWVTAPLWVPGALLFVAAGLLAFANWADPK